MKIQNALYILPKEKLQRCRLTIPCHDSMTRRQYESSFLRYHIALLSSCADARRHHVATAKNSAYEKALFYYHVVSSFHILLAIAISFYQFYYFTSMRGELYAIMRCFDDLKCRRAIIMTPCIGW